MMNKSSENGEKTKDINDTEEMMMIEFGNKLENSKVDNNMSLHLLNIYYAMR